MSCVAAACSSGTGPSENADTTSSSVATAMAPVTFIPRVAATPVAYPPQPDGVPWPTDEWPTGPIPDGVDAAAVQAAIDDAFGPSNPEQGPKFDGLVVVSGGRLVAERYRPGFGGPDSIHQSWSMAKSFTAALAGILVRDNKLDIYAPAAVPAWSDPADPRHAITTDQLLRMASGLEWDENYVGPTADITAMLAGVGKDDMAAYAASKPAAVPPDTRVSYSTGTTNIIAGIIGDTVGRGDPYRAFLQDELLSPIGIDAERARPGFDASGTFIGGSQMDTTARDFARFGYLHLRNGMWDGRQILPTGWVDYVRTPTPAPAGLVGYGAQFWVVPEHPSEFYASGLVGQHILVAPKLDLVIVVLSDRTDQLDFALVDELTDLFAAGRER
jgi:CubicO group peptidase (beta-lactamase class C family)